MKKISLKYYLLVTFILITILSNERLLLLTKLLIEEVTDFNMQASNFYLFIDYASMFLIFVISGILTASSWDSQILKVKVKVSHGFLIIIFSMIILFPLISGSELAINRESIFASKMPPMTKLKYFTLKPDSISINYLSTKVFYQSGSTKKIFFQKFTDNGQIEYSINGNKQFLDRSKILLKNNQPIVGSKIFLLGTDEFGNDLFVEILYGIRKSIFIALIASLISFIIGSSLGYFSAINKGFGGIIINRISESLFSIPSILLFIIILMFWGSSGLTIPIVLGLTGWITIFKVVRNEMIIILQKPFFQMSHKLGLSGMKLLWLEILPYISAQLFMTIIFMFGNFVIGESSLSFLGLGNENVYSSLGNLIQRGNYYLPQYYWMTLFPALSLSLIIVVLNSIKSEIRRSIDARIK